MPAPPRPHPRRPESPGQPCIPANYIGNIAADLQAPPRAGPARRGQGEDPGRRITRLRTASPFYRTPVGYGGRMAEEAVLVALPGTMCSPAVFDRWPGPWPGELVVDPVSWLTQPGPWDIPAVADRVADHIERSWGRPVLVCGHSTGGAIALQLAIRRPAAVLGLVLVDTGAHMRGHADVGAILDRIRPELGRGTACGRPRPVIPVSAPPRGPRRVPGVGGRARSAGGLRCTRQPARPRPDRRPGRDPAARPSSCTAATTGPDRRSRAGSSRSPCPTRISCSSTPGHTPVYETPEAVAAGVRDVLTRAAHPPAP